MFCGGMNWKIENDESYLIIDEERKKIRLQPSLFHPAGIHTDSSIIYFMDEVPQLKFSVTIESTILPCIVETGRFAITASDIGVYVGEPELAYKLPDSV